MRCGRLLGAQSEAEGMLDEELGQKERGSGVCCRAGRGAGKKSHFAIPLKASSYVLLAAPPAIRLAFTFLVTPSDHLPADPFPVLSSCLLSPHLSSSLSFCDLRSLCFLHCFLAIFFSFFLGWLLLVFSSILTLIA